MTQINSINLKEKVAESVAAESMITEVSQTNLIEILLEILRRVRYIHQWEKKYIDDLIATFLNLLILSRDLLFNHLGRYRTLILPEGNLELCKTTIDLIFITL